MTGTLVFRLAILFVGPNLIYAGTAFWVRPAVLIALLNSMLMSLAFGVCVAYSSNVRLILLETDRRIERSDLLALGIFCSWTAIVCRCIWSLCWRYAGQPDDWTDTHVVSYLAFLSVCASLFHLLAPAAVGNHIPTVHWIKIGALSAAGVMALILVSWAVGFFPG